MTNAPKESLWENIYGLDNVGKINSDNKRYFYLKDHLGSIRAVLDTTNAVVSAQDYDCWGYLLESRTYQSNNTKYKYTGKDRDNENNFDYFGARYYDSRIGRWGGVDNLQLSYISISPYSYAINNPTVLTDPNGLKIDLGKVPDEYRTEIINDLKSFTSLDLYLDNDNYLQIGEISSSDGNISSIARDYIENAIESDEVLTVETSADKTTEGVIGGKNIYLNPNEIKNFISGVNGGLNSKTLGWGMNFIHELLHTSFGFSIGHENESKFGDIGLVVQTMNKIRGELGKDFGQRLSYGPFRISMSYDLSKYERYLPFDKAAFDVMNKIINDEKLHKMKGMYIKY